MGNGEPWFILADSLKEPSDITLRDDYIIAFVNPKTKIVPVESIYRQWSEGQKAELPFAQEKGYLVSDKGLHMKALLNQYGLEIPAEFLNTPDNLIIELEFLGFLIENQKLSEAKIFIEEHLDWLDELVEVSEEKLPKGNYFYTKLLEIKKAVDSSLENGFDTVQSSML